MADADLQITFSADASGVQQGVAAAAASIRSIKPAIADALDGVKSFGVALTEAFKSPDLGGVAKAAARAVDVLAAQKAAIAEQIEALKLKAAVGQISATQMYDQIAALQRRENQDELSANMASYNATMDALKAKFAASQDDLSAQRKIADKMVELAADTAQRTTKINAQGLKQQEADRLASLQKFKQAWNSVVDPLVSGFTSGLMQMAEGTKSFAQVVRGMGQQILNDALRLVDRMVERWLWGEVAKRAATQTSVTARMTAERAGASQSAAISGAASLKEIANSAAVAAGDAYKAMAGIPVIGPVLGAAAAATVFAAVMAFKGLISSAAGGFDVPAGVNPITQLHAQEMVLPARLANPLRDMLEGFSAASSNGFGVVKDGAGGGDFHAHFHMGPGSDGPALQRWFDTHGEKLMRTVNGQLRGNAKLYGV